MDSGVQRNKKQNPVEKANIFSLTIFGWLFPFLYKGYQKDLKENDIYEVTKNLNSEKITNNLEKHWEFLKFNNKKTSLIKLLINCYGKRYITIGIIQLIMECLSSVLRPWAIAKLVQYFVPNQTEITRNEAYVYASFTVGIMLLNAFYETHISFWKAVLSLEIRMAFSSLIYRKVLKLHPKVLSEMSTGKIVTLITKDLQTIDMAVYFTNDFWIELLIGTFIGYLIYQKVGLAALVIIISFIVILPVQGKIGFSIFKQRKAANKKSDERIQLTQEILSVIRIIKMYTWEKFFTNKVDDARKNEINKLRNVLLLKQGGIAMGDMFGKLGYNCILIVYLLLGNTLTPEVVYYVASSYQKIRFILTYLITLSFTELAELMAAFTRIENLFQAEEYILKKQVKQINTTKILMKNIYVNIDKEDIIKNININFEKGLNLITGPVGSGKSMLIKTILQEYTPNSGNFFINGEISYASQQPWLFPSTIRQNILFGEEYNEERYKKVIEICALNFDLKLFKDGDKTIVTESGANLSKGQQARVNLARAIYKKSDIYILDDCFSALDVNVQNLIFKNCVKNFLNNKLIILATHNTNFIEHSDNLIIIDDGKVKFNGKYDDSVQIKNFMNETKNIDETQLIKEEDEEKLEEIMEINGKIQNDEKNVKDENVFNENSKIGRIGFETYKRYIKFGGFFLFFFLVFLHVSVETLYASTEKLVSKWVNDQKVSNFSSQIEKEENSKAAVFTITLLSSLTAATILAKFIRAIVHFLFSMKISKNIHFSLITNVINANVNFFDRNLIGNILNRFSRDLGMVDEVLPYIVSEVMRMAFMTASTIGLVVSVNLMFLYLSFVLLAVMVSAALFFTPSARSLRRLEATSRSPMIGHLNSTVEGLITARAFKKQDILKKEFDLHQNYNISTQYISLSSWKILQLFGHVLCSIFVASIITTFLIFQKEFKAGDVGLSLTTAVALGMQLQWGVRNLIFLESTMTCVERIMEYIDEEQEDRSGKKIENWPNSGKISFEKVSLTYPFNSNQVLKNLNFDIDNNKKIGIVGRTGAGKSSIIVTLYRFYKFNGTISIDDKNINEISLDNLREKISIIPQEPIIFSGTIRSNIDPDNIYTDEEIWNCLKIVNLNDLIKDLDKEIDTKTCGLSLGEKQLISIARAFIKNNKIVILDEATANMDKDTEIYINKRIKEIFNKCTLLIIAHRMETILDCDKVIVMDKGEILEYDNPLILAKDINSKFYEIIKKTGALNAYLERTS